jgi:hypothetical protein
MLHKICCQMTTLQQNNGDVYFQVPLWMIGYLNI